ncbi:MAG: hypothetical protein HYZ23_02200 [Chloroflexi bacterium]|nr:hypothetical protein [Chloroflexota bacterium]
MNTNLFSLLRPSVFFDADSGGGGGGNEKDEKPETKGKTFTQEELDALFAQRAAQAKGSALADLFKEIGVENADGLKTLIAKAKEADDAQKTELQKAQDKATAAEKSLADQKDAHEKTLAELGKRILDTEIKIAAGREIKDKDGKIIRPKFRTDALDVVLLSVARKDIAEKEGAYTGIEEALGVLAKEKPFLTEAESTTTQRGTPGGERPRKPNPKQDAATPTGKHSRF